MEEGPYTWDEDGNRVSLDARQLERISHAQDGAGTSNQPEPILLSQHGRRDRKRILKYWSPGRQTDGFWLTDWMSEHGVPLTFLLIPAVLLVAIVVRLIQSFF